MPKLMPHTLNGLLGKNPTKINYFKLLSLAAIYSTPPAEYPYSRFGKLISDKGESAISRGASIVHDKGKKKSTTC